MKHKLFNIVRKREVSEQLFTERQNNFNRHFMIKKLTSIH
jgi:hypothetical protein